MAMLHRSKLTFDMFTFSPAEREMAMGAAKGLLAGP